MGGAHQSTVLLTARVAGAAWRHAASHTVIGRHLANFYIVGRVGSGGMGDVFEAQDMRLPRTVALKILKPALAVHDLAVKRFRREAWLAASLNHPNICTILDVGEAEGVLFIAMELLQGESLKQRLRGGPLPMSHVVRVATDVVRALIAAHDVDIVHRDLTPGNVFLTDAGVAKLLDFGLAKVLPMDDGDASASGTVTGPSAVPGTIHHLAPEQLLGSTVDRRTDLFALGTVLYFAATGARPFDAATKDGIIAKILQDTPVPLRRLAPDCPVGLDRIVSRLLEKSPDQRYQRASDVLKDLEAIRPDTETRKPRTTSRRLSVAVLPFAILGDSSADLRGFRDGLPEDLAWWLRKVRGVRVAPRTSTASIKDRSISAIGRQLGVDLLLEGSVQRAGDRLRVIVNFLQADTEEPMRPPLRLESAGGDLLAAQDVISRGIVDAVTSALAQANVAVTSRNLEAHGEYQKGMHHLRDMFGGGWQPAIEHATRAAELDPGFALPHVLLADAYCFLGLLSLMTPRIAFRKARLAAQRALVLDVDLAAAHASLAVVRFGDDWDWDGAEAAFRRALGLDPDLAHARIYYSWLLGLLGRQAAAFQQADRAATTSRSKVVRIGAALTYFMAERYDETIARCNECLAREPDYIFATYLRGQCYHMLRRYEEAHADLERAAELGHRAPFYLGLLGKSYGEAGRRDRAAALLDELAALAKHQYVAPHCYVYILHGMGEGQRALEYQEQAYIDGATPMNYLTPFIREMFARDPHHRDRLRQMRLIV